jgi:hypothetical protein
MSFRTPDASISFASAWRSPGESLAASTQFRWPEPGDHFFQLREIGNIGGEG